MADSYISVARFNGGGTGSSGEVSIGKNDVDTVKYLEGSALLLEGDVLSVHDLSDSDYQNTSGFNAVAALVIEARSLGAATRHIKVYYGPTTDDTTGATLLWEAGEVDSAWFDANGDTITTPPLTIPNNQFIIVENVDDSRTGVNDIRLEGSTSNSIKSFVVERGA